MSSRTIDHSGLDVSKTVFDINTFTSDWGPHPSSRVVSINRCTFHEWLERRGIEWPNLGVNMPAGNAWGAAEMLSYERRAWREYHRAGEAR